MGIINADSHEEGIEKLMSYPLFLFTDFQVYPLSDVNHVFDQFTKLLQTAAASM